MDRRSAIRNLAVAGAVSCLDRVLRGGPQDAEPNYTIHSDVRLVLLDVSVKDRQGGFVTGLSKDNFGVFEDGRPQKITVFDRGDVPVTVGILVDESGSMKPRRADVLRAAFTFIDESNRNDEIFVLNFNDTVTRGLPQPVLFSDDIRELHSALYRGVPQGKTALNDAIVAGLKQLELGKRDKKTLVVISDGGDNASEHTRQETFETVERSIATIYAIGLFDADNTDRDPGMLRQLARISGGEAYFPASPSGMVSVCRGIAKDIRNRYTVGYLPQAGNGRSSVRHIRVRASAPDHARLIMRTRNTYRYDEGEDRTKQ